MPATPYTAIPYARSERPSGLPYVSNGRLGDLVRQRGQDAAEAELRRGDISAQMWGNVGNAVTQAVGGYFQQKQEEPIRRMQAERAQLDLDAARRAGEAEQRLTRQDSAFASLFEMFPDGNIPPKEVMSIYGPQRGMQIASGLQAFSELATQKVTDARATAGRLAVGLKALSPALQQQFWPAARQAAIAAGLGDEQNIPEQLTGDFLDFVIGSATGQAPTAARTPTREIRTRGADGSETVQIVPDTPGQTFSSAAAPQGSPQWVMGRDGQEHYRVPQQGDRQLRAPSTAQPEMVTLVGPNGEQRDVARGSASNALLGQGWKYRDAVAERAAVPNDPAGARQTTESALLLARRLYDPEKRTAHAGMNRATGAYELRGFTQDAVDFNSIRDQLVASLALPNLGALKGPMSDKDILFVKNISTRLDNRNLSRAETEKAIGEAIQFLQGKLASTPPTSPGVMVNMRAPDGRTLQVPAEQVDEAKRRGATVVGQ